MAQRFQVRRLVGHTIAVRAFGTGPFARAADTPIETPGALSVARKAMADYNARATPK